MGILSDEVTVATDGSSTITLTGGGSVVWLKSLDGAGIVSARIDSGTPDTSAGTDDQWWLAAAPGDTVPIPCPKIGTVTVNLDATAATRVTAWREQPGRI